MKFNVNQEVYFINKDRCIINRGKIFRIDITASHVWYEIECFGYNGFCTKSQIDEKYIFLSLEECRQYIKDNVKEIFPLMGGKLGEF